MMSDINNEARQVEEQFPLQLGRVIRVIDGVLGDSVVVEINESVGYCHVIVSDDGAEKLSMMSTLKTEIPYITTPERWELNRLVGALTLTMPLYSETEIQAAFIEQWEDARESIP